VKDGSIFGVRTWGN